MMDQTLAVPRMSVLDPGHCEQIIEAAYKILDSTGIKIDHGSALELFRKAGCNVKGDIVKIDADIIQGALETIPEMVTIHNRQGEAVMELGGRNTYFGPGLTNTFFIDPFNGERRDALASDVAYTAIVSDALEHIDFVMGLSGSTDYPPQYADIIEMDRLLKNTSKPLVGWSIDQLNSKIIFNMLTLVAKSREKFMEKPFAVMYAGSCTSGLTHSKNEIDKLFFWIENGVPCTYTGSGQFGVTSPVTVAGALAQGMAESLSTILLTQLIRPGAPFLSACCPMTMDMKTMVTCYGAPESFLSYMAEADLHQHLNVPVFSIAGASESKADDGQAAIENAISITSTMFSGNNLIHDLGFLESGMTGSLTQLVSANEMIGLLKHMKRGIRINDETLALDAIERLGPGGSFLTEADTFLNFKKELWQPQLIDRARFHEWEEKKTGTLEQRAAKKVIDILNYHKPIPLSSKILTEMGHLVDGVLN